jgi:hypothetical protein
MIVADLEDATSAICATLGWRADAGVGNIMTGCSEGRCGQLEANLPDVTRHQLLRGRCTNVRKDCPSRVQRQPFNDFRTSDVDVKILVSLNP